MQREMFNGKRLMVEKTMMKPTPSSRPPTVDTLWQVILMSFGAGDEDAWVIKLDANGNVQWQKTYGGKGDDEAYSIQQTSDGGYIVAGWTNSYGAGGLEMLGL